jgi:hypothetical protein
MTSEASFPKPPNVFIYSEDTKDEIPNNVIHVKVDPSVKEIHDEAFKEHNSLIKVEFSEGLERIGVEAFGDCRNLQHVNKLPSTLKEIGTLAFAYCLNLDSIQLPERLQVIAECAFAHCRGLKRIKIPSAHVVIKRGVFVFCGSLISVELPEGLQVIGVGWFAAGCASLTTVNVPSSVIEIQDGAFAGCASLASLDLPEGLQSIGPGSFSCCESLATLHIPSTVCKMGRGVFWDCTGLRSITLPDALETIEDKMFYNCNSLTHIEIPSKVTNIGVEAFKYCGSLKHLRTPSSVVEIGASAFACCKKLTSVHLLGNLRTIEEDTFRSCASLTHVRIPWSVTRIERGAFAECTRLISLELPEGLERIHLNETFFRDEPSIYGCQSLVNLAIPSEQHVVHLDPEEFMEDLKLRYAASNFDDLVSKLQHRFDTLAVHRLCYYQSYYPLTEAMENLRQSMDADLSAGTKADSFGMTPFHILALSQTPNLSLFQALMKVYQVDIIHTRDKFGSTPIDYLCLNHTSDSTMVIESLLQAIIAERLQWLGRLARWKSEILTTMDEALAAEGPSRQRKIGLLCFQLATYERLESMSLLELALWRVKIRERKPVNQEEQLGEEGSLKKIRLVASDLSQEEGVYRQSCRINSGAEVVISNVLPFLDEVCREDYYVEH